MNRELIDKINALISRAAEMNKELADEIEPVIREVVGEVTKGETDSASQADEIKALAVLMGTRAYLQSVQDRRVSDIKIIHGVVCMPVRRPYARTFHYEPLIDHL